MPSPNLAAASITVTSATGHTTATLAQRFGAVLNVKTDFGCVGNGTEEGAKIQNALNALQIGGSATALYFPAGTYNTGQVLYITNTTGVRIFGDGTISTMIQYTGSPTAGNTETNNPGSIFSPDPAIFTPVIMTNGFSYSEFSGIRLNAPPGANTCGIYLYQHYPSTNKGTTEQLNIHDVLVDGGCATGYFVGYAAGALCSEIMFTNCVVNSCTAYGFRNLFANALNNNLYNCGGVGNAIWASIPTGSMDIYGASLAGNTLDIEVGGAGAVSVVGCRSESISFLATTGEAIVAISGCTQNTGVSGTGFFVYAESGSPVTITGCRVLPNFSSQGKINGSNVQITIIGSYFDTTDPFSGLTNSTLALINNYFVDSTPFGSIGSTTQIVDLKGNQYSAFLTTSTIANLPTAGSHLKGVRGYVTDSTTAATATSFSLLVSTLTGGGSNVVPVWCDGSAWRIG